MDDGTLGGKPEIVLNDLKLFIQACKNIGLEIKDGIHGLSQKEQDNYNVMLTLGVMDLG